MKQKPKPDQPTKEQLEYARTLPAGEAKKYLAKIQGTSKPKKRRGF